MDKIKEQLTKKLGAENVSIIEEAVKSATSDMCKQLVEFKAENANLKKQKGFLNRKLSSQAKLNEEQLKSKLDEQKDKIISVSQSYVDEEINKREQIIESLNVEKQRMAIQLAESFENYFNSDIFPHVKQLIEAKQKTSDNSSLMEAITKTVIGSVKKAKKSKEHLQEVVILKNKIAELQKTVSQTVNENLSLKNKVILLSETRGLDEKEADEVAESVEDQSSRKQGYGKMVKEAKQRLLERRRRSIKKVRVDEDDRKKLSENVSLDIREAPVMNEAVSKRIIDLISD